MSQRAIIIMVQTFFGFVHQNTFRYSKNGANFLSGNSGRSSRRCSIGIKLLSSSAKLVQGRRHKFRNLLSSRVSCPGKCACVRNALNAMQWIATTPLAPSFTSWLRLVKRPHPPSPSPRVEPLSCVTQARHELFPRSAPFGSSLPRAPSV